jgi:hypothetical protein
MTPEKIPPIPITRGMIDMEKKFCPVSHKDTVEMMKIGKVVIVDTVQEVQAWIDKYGDASCKAQ